MKILTNKRYEELLAAEVMSGELTKYTAGSMDKLTAILDRMVEKEGRENSSAYVTASKFNDWAIGAASIDEDYLKEQGYARLIETYSGEKIFEHKATDLIHIDKEGKVTKHKTKETDKGYSYKLIRE